MNTHNRPNAKANLQNKSQSAGDATVSVKIEQNNELMNASADSNDNDLAEYIITQDDILTEDEDVMAGAVSEHENQLLLYGDVGVDMLTQSLKPQGIILKRGKQHFIEDINGIEHEITIADGEDGMELLAFEDDDLE